MAQLDILAILKSKDIDPLEFEFDRLTCPPIHHFLSNQDINELRSICTSISLSSKTEEKYRLIKNIMTRNGFARFAGGTNRVVYRHYENPNIVAKIALDKIGREANLSEQITQHFIKPYCAKTFYVTLCGTVSLAERVMPISNRLEYLSIARYVFRIIFKFIIGNYVADDIGTDYFLNVGVRNGFGVVFLDYPYIYPLNGNRLYCSKIMEDGTYCDGEIDYDDGFNELHCTKCGKRYFARDLRKDNIINMPIIRKGGFSTMKINLMRGDEIVFTPVKKSNYYVKPGRKTASSPVGCLASKIILTRGDQIINFRKVDEETIPNNELLNQIKQNIDEAKKESDEKNIPVVTAEQQTDTDYKDLIDKKDEPILIVDKSGSSDTVTVTDDLKINDSVSIIQHYEEIETTKEDDKPSYSLPSEHYERKETQDGTERYKVVRDIRTQGRQLEPAVKTNFNPSKQV